MNDDSSTLPGGGVTRQAVHTVAVRSVTLIVRFALVVAITKTLPPGEYGAYALIMAIHALGIYIAGLNLFTYVYRTVPALRPEEQLRVFKTTVVVEAAVSLLLVTVFLAAGGLSPALRYFNVAAYESTFALGLFLLVPLVCVAEINYFFLAQGRIERANWVDFLGQAAWALPLLALRAGGMVITVPLLLWGQIGGAVAVAIYASRHIDLGRWWRTRVDWSVLRTGVLFSLPLMLPAIGEYSLRLADRLVLVHFHSAADVGVYSFAAVFVNTIYSFTAGVVCGAFGPRIFAAHNGDARERRDVLQSYMLKISLSCFLIAFTLLWLGIGPLVDILARPEYRAAASLIPIMGISMMLLVIAYPANFMLMLRNRVLLIAAIDLTGMALGLAVNLALVPRFSYYGAAVGSVIGLSMTTVLKYWLSGVHKHLQPAVLWSIAEERLVLQQWLRRVRQVFA